MMRLGARLDSHYLVSTNSRHLNLCSQSSIHHADRDFIVDVIAVSDETLSRGHHHYLNQ
jgi:hypothetical protein